MMDTHQAQRLVDSRAAAYAVAKDVLTRAGDEGRDLTAEEEAIVERSYADVDRLSKQIDLYAEGRKLDERFAAVDAESAERRARLAHELGAPVEDVEDRSAEAFRAYVRTGQVTPELRAAAVATGAAGGYAAPAGFWSKVTETMLFYGGMLTSGIEVIRTTNGNPLSWPTNDDTSNSGTWLGAENVAISDATDLSFGLKTLNAHPLSSNVVKVSRQYLEDVDPIASEGFIARKVGERIGRSLNTAYTTGNGVGRPYGFTVGATTGKTTASATAITYGELVDLQHSVDVAYRSMPGCVFMLHDLILAYVRKLLDSQNRPLWEPSLQAGAPSTLLGFPVVVNNDMASTVATTNKTVAFGHFGAHYVGREVGDAGSLQRLTERYADYAQVGFIGFGRYDGQIQDASAVKLLVQA